MLIYLVTLAASDEGYVITAWYKRLLYVEEMGIMFDQNCKALCFKDPHLSMA